MKIIKLYSQENLSSKYDINKKLNAKTLSYNYTFCSSLGQAPPQDRFIPFGSNSPKVLKPFLQEFEHAYKHSDIATVLLNSANKKNILGTGYISTCFRIPRINNYVFRLPTNLEKQGITLFQKPLNIIEDEFDGRNYGQTVIQIGEHVQILKKVDGTSHSLNPWIFYIKHPDKITQKDAHNFLKCLERISEFGQDAYDNLAASIGYLNLKGKKIDSVNPNNIMIDNKHKKFGIIDLNGKKTAQYKNTSYDMISSLLDYGSFKNIYNLLNETEKQKLLKTARVIINKCHNAGTLANLSNNESDYLGYLSYFDKIVAGVSKQYDNIDNLTTRYNNMKQILGIP